MFRQLAPVKRLIAISRHCPALPLALAVGVGQVAMWFLHFPEALLIVVVIGALAAVRGRCASSLLLGAVLGIFSAYPAVASRVPLLSAQDVQVVGVVQEEPRHPKTGEVVFVLRSLGIAGEPLIRCRSVELPWRNAALLSRGDTVWVRGALEAVSRPLNPFSWEGRLYRKGISAELKARFVSKPLAAGTSWVSNVRATIERTIEQGYGDRRGGQLFLSMAFGYQDRLSRYVEDAFRGLGLTHLLVVSGYQVSLVFGFIMWLAGQVVVFLPGGAGTRTAATVTALTAASGYVVLVGSEMSAIRALIAAACLCAVVVCEHGSRFAQRWGVALLIMQLAMPWSGFDMGVQLTFAALAGIGVGSTLGAGSSWRAYWWVALSTWLFTSAVLLAWGSSVSWSGVVGNVLLAAPWSILNCVVGGAGFLLYAAGGDWCRGVLDIVVIANELVADGVLWASEYVGSGYKPEGLARAVLLVGDVVLCVYLMQRARIVWPHLHVRALCRTRP